MGRWVRVKSNIPPIYLHYHSVYIYCLTTMRNHQNHRLTEFLITHRYHMNELASLTTSTPPHSGPATVFEALNISYRRVFGRKN